MLWSTKLLGRKYKKGEKRVTFEEWLPIYEQVSKEKEVGGFHDFMEGLKVFDKDGTGKIQGAEIRHILMALGERMNGEQVDWMLEGAEDANGCVNYEAFIKKVMAGPFPEEAPKAWKTKLSFPLQR